VNRRFQIVVIPPGREAWNTRQLTHFSRFKRLLAALAAITVILAVLIAALILGYIIAVVLSIAVIMVIALLFVKSFFRRPTDRRFG
jgi:type IV secretory pathway VirB6-like protein